MKHLSLLIFALVAALGTFVNHLLNTGQISMPTPLAIAFSAIQLPALLVATLSSGNVHQPNVPMAYCLLFFTYFGLCVVIAAIVRRVRSP